MIDGRKVLVVALQIVILSVYCVTPEQHDRLPALYELDDWHSCDIAPERDWYCIVRVILTGDAVTGSSSHFEINDLQRFRRTLLDRGLCLTSSQRDASNVNAALRSNSFPTAWNKFDRYVLNRSYFPPAMHPDVRTELAASEVINRRIASQYGGLSAYTEIEYCLKNDPKPQFEQAITVALAMTLVLGCVLLLNARRWLGKAFAPQTEAKSIKQFALFDAYKCFGSVGVVIAHCCLFGPFLMPMSNIERLEESIAHPNVKVWRLLCPFLMLAFFTMSSMLLTVKLLHANPTDRPTFGAIIMNRLIRLVPLNLLMVAFATFVYDRFIGGGPLGARQLIMEQGFCRSTWWMNVLFISNFNMHKPCLPDSWYVSSDLQLYILITLAIKAMFRIPKHTALIVAFMAASSFLGPFLTVLWTDFDPVGPVNLHEMRFFLLGSDFMSKLYTPFYNNLAWSVCGMIAGIVYDRFQRTDPHSGTQQKILHRLNLAVIILLVMLGLSISATIAASNDESQNNRLWLAFCYSTYKLLGASLIAALFLRILLIEKEIAIPPIARIGATLYYCVYFIHFPIMRIVYCSDIVKETTVTTLLLLQKALKVYGITYVLSVLLHYTYENSAIKLLRRIFFGRV
ncbi:regulator of hypoxia-inducible factor 1-like [Anopheles marshallii]|uniref:regulator of hypoxia-inducible factor 1-like n=1 Tax=Anopheles marshallii TaxID=1521116 RepID=UPI00237AD357|nr:regulator of hypoxia-inducible factor 1-like [Anopheles marshallii]